MFRSEITFVNVVCILNLGQKICPISPKFWKILEVCFYSFLMLIVV